MYTALAILKYLYKLTATDKISYDKYSISCYMTHLAYIPGNKSKSY